MTVPPVLSVGPALKLPAGGRPRPAPVPVDISRSLEGLLSAIDFDVVHVHDPFAPSAASAALRHSRALNAGHLPPADRARPLDPGRAAARRDLLRAPRCPDGQRAAHRRARRAVLPGQLRDRPAGGRGRRAPSRCRAGRCGSSTAQREERGALRILLRALRKLPLDLDWEADIWIERRRDPDAADEQPAARTGPDPPPGGDRRRGRGRGRGRSSVRGIGRAAAGAEPDPCGLRGRRGAGRRADRRLRGARRRRGRRARPRLPGRRLADARRPARAADPRRGAARRLAAAGAGVGPVVRRRRRPARGGLRADRVAPPRPDREPGGAPADRAAADDRLRPPHAHRSLERLRDAGRGPARDRQGPRHGCDRGHRPQRDLRRARRPRGRRADR